MFTVRSDVCGRIIGIQSEPLIVQFKGNNYCLHNIVCTCIIILLHPYKNFTVIDPPTLKIIPHFSCIDQTLTVDISFNKSVRTSIGIIIQSVN